MNVFSVTLGIVFLLVILPILLWTVQALLRGARRAGRLGTRTAR